MAQQHLTPSVVNQAICPSDKKKLDLFDTQTKGLVLEVRESGGKTYYLRYQDHRGKTRQLRLAAAQDVTLPQARTLADKARNRIAMGNDPSEKKTELRSTPTFTEFITDRYMPYAKGYKKSWNTDDSYLRNHLLPALGKKHLDEITKHDVIAFHHGMRSKDYALGTCNRCLILLRYAMNLAVRWEIPGMKANPTKDVPLFEDLAGKKERYLSQEEAKRLFEAVQRSENTMLRFIVPMLILTGARKREVLDAQWEDFDLPHRQWRIPTTKSGRPRHVPLSDGVLKLLASVPHDPDCPWIFANPKTRRPYVSVFISWNTARKNAGLAEVRMHDLRHSFASFLVNAGRSLYEVQKILGHTQVKTTQRYAHLAQETLVDACNSVVNSLGDAFGPVGMTQQAVPMLPVAA
jgi:integrase